MGRVLARMQQLPWNKYLDISVDALESTPWDYSQFGASTRFYRGSEHAILAFARAMGVRHMVVSQHHYPGYERIAREVGASLSWYECLAELTSELACPRSTETLIVLTIPGNPLDIAGASDLDLPRIDHCRVLIDAAYQNPFSAGFLPFVTSWLSQRAAISFTLSKLACLAAVRLGAIVTRSDADLLTAPGKPEWDLLSVSMIDVLGAGDGLALAREASERQELLGHLMVNAFENAGIVVAGRGGGCFATVASDAIPFTLLDRLTGLKSFGPWLRIDASQRNLLAIRDALKIGVST